MRKIIFISIILLTTMVNGQEEFYNTPWAMQFGLQKITELKNIPSNATGVTKTYTQYSLKGKPVSISKNMYAVSDGKVDGLTVYNKREKVIEHYQAYYQDSLIIRIDVLNKNGKNKKTYHISSPNKYYYNLNYFSESQHGKLKSSIKAEYTKVEKKTLLASKTVCKGKKEKPISVWKYDYHDDFSLKTTTQFTGKGKIKHIWSHECKPEGEDLNASRDTTLICKNTSVNENGEIITVIISSDAKNKITKRIYTYDSKEHLKLMQIFNSDNTLTYECNIMPGKSEESKLYTSKSYNKKGELLYTNISEYNKDNLIVSSEFINHLKKEDYISRAEYEYNSDKSVKSITTFNKDKASSKTEYEYRY